MEDSKLQALHEALSQLRGKKGLGTNSQYSWQRGTASTTETFRHPAAAKLPNNALYAHFLPEGVYDPKAAQVNDGDGRVVKRDFTDAIIGDRNASGVDETALDSSTEKEQRKALRKEAKKEAKKAAKLKAKREVKLDEKKKQRKLEKKLLKKQSSNLSELSSTGKEAVPEGKPVICKK
jgi:hypothetical protein